MPSTELAGYANLALYSAMVVFAVAMLVFTAHLAALGPPVVSAEAKDSAGDKVLVGAGATAGDESGSAGSAGSGSSGSGSSGSGSSAATTSGSGRAASAPEGSLSPRARTLGSVGLSLTWLATILLVAAVAMRGIAVARVPWGNMFEFAVAAAAAGAFAYSVLARRKGWQWLGLFVTGPVLLTLGLALVGFYTEAAELQPALKSVFLVIHVIVAILASAAFAIGFSTAALYLARLTRSGATSRRWRWLGALPSAARLERLTYAVNMVGFILYTFTLIAGAIWAQKAWGSYWNWDPKEVWTFIVWSVYAAYMHARATAGWEPRRATYLALAAFGALFVNFTVVNIFLPGQHSYSGL